MIGTIDIKLNAAHPNMPLAPLYTFRGSPSQVRVINVPKAIGKWAVNSVQVIANYPDNSVETVTATLVGGCWSATLVAPTAVGQSLNGFTITASGTDESGAAVTGYILGKGDLFVLDNDATITIGTATYYVHLVATTPANPKEGDLALDTMKLWDGSAWRSLGGGAVASVNGKVGAVVLTGADINYSDSTTVKNAIDNVGDLASAAMSTAGEASSAISAHTGNTNNPHGVSCGQIGAVAITDGVLTQGPSGHLETDAIKSLEGHYIAVPSEDGTMALKSDIPDVSGKLSATSAAAAFSAATAYAVGDYVTKDGALYKCTAAHSAGAWNAAHFTAETMMDFDSALVLNDATGALRVTDASGSVVWTSDNARKYALVTTSTTTPAADSVSLLTVPSAGATITIPTDVSGKVTDFIVDAYAADGGTITIGNIGAVTIFTDDGVSLVTDVLTMAEGEVARIAFTSMAYRPDAKPTYHAAKQVLVKYTAE